MAKIVTIEIDEEGNQTVDLEGYQGKGCHAVQEVFARAVGQSTKAVRKPEFNKAPKNNVRVTR